MWKPKERINFETKVTKWPSAEEAANSLLFSPLKYKNLTVQNRCWIPAMVPWRATEQGEVTQDVIDWYRRFAKAKPGAIIVEATGIRDIASGPLLRASHDRYIDGLRKIVTAVKQASHGQTQIYIQLIDFLSIRRRPRAEDFFSRFLQITDLHFDKTGLSDEQAVRDYLLGATDETRKSILTEREFEDYMRGYRERVTDMDLDHIRDLPEILPELFAQAAIRAQRAGFDGVELHYAHAYTMASFLSALNTRDDGYGGSVENRCRLPLQVYHTTRQAVGDDYTLGCRMLSEECLEGGSSVSDALYFSEKFARAGMDFISLSRGGKFEDAATPKAGQAIYPYTGQSGYECMPHHISDSHGPWGRNLAPAVKIKSQLKKSQLKTPIILAGGMHGFYQVEEILQNGDADIVGFARQALADPDWFTKVLSGSGDNVNLCLYSNYCEGLDQKHKMVTCQLWDRKRLDEPNLRLTPDGKRRTTAP